MKGLIFLVILVLLSSFVWADETLDRQIAKFQSPVIITVVSGEESSELKDMSNEELNDLNRTIYESFGGEDLGPYDEPEWKDTVGFFEIAIVKSESGLVVQTTVGFFSEPDEETRQATEAKLRQEYTGKWGKSFSKKEFRPHQINADEVYYKINLKGHEFWLKVVRDN